MYSLLYFPEHVCLLPMRVFLASFNCLRCGLCQDNAKTIQLLGADTSYHVRTNMSVRRGIIEALASIIYIYSLLKNSEQQVDV